MSQPRFSAMRCRYLAAAATVLRERSGMTAVSFAAAAPVVLMLVAAAIDYSRFVAQKSLLQAATDAAVLAAAKDMSLTDAARHDLSDVARLVAETYLSGQSTATRHGTPAISASIDHQTLGVTVNASQTFVPMFPNMAGLVPTAIAVRADARVVGRPNICVLALEKDQIGAISLAKSARMTGDDCSIFSNSTSSRGIVLRDDAVLTAKSICSAGGIEGAGLASPPGITDCPTFEDPLAGRPEPTAGSCQFNDKSIKDQVVSLTPGVYCGGLEISGSSVVTFESGDYLILGGKFAAGGGAVLEGEGVSFYLGPSSRLLLDAESTVRFTATRTGPMAGLLFFGSRQTSPSAPHTIYSRNAQHFVGTIYMPNATLRIDGEAKVGGASAYTAIVAKQLELLAGPQLILNARYDETDVPVPAGIRGATQPVRLVK